MTAGWDRFEGDIGWWVCGKIQETGNAIVRRIGTIISPPTKRSQSPLAIHFSTGLLERCSMLTATGFTPLLVNLESMTAKPRADGGGKNCVAKKVVHNIVHADKVTTDSSTD